MSYGLAIEKRDLKIDPINMLKPKYKEIKINAHK